MDSNMIIPPIWNKLDKVHGSLWYNYGWLDYANVGPVVNIYLNSNTRNSTNIHDSPKQHCIAYNNKDTGRKFPVEKALDFMYPVTIPLYVTKSRAHTTGNHLWLLSGNSMDCFDTQGETYVVSVRKRNEIVFSKIHSNARKGVTKGPNDKMFSSLESYSVVYDINHQNFRAVQVITKDINGRPYLVARSRKGMIFAMLNENLQPTDTQCKQMCNKSEMATSVAMSETLPGCLAMATSHGYVSLYEYPDQKPIWKCHFLEDLGSQETVYQCGFGRHGFPSLMVNNKSTLWLCDTRCTKKEINSSSDNMIVNLKDLAIYIPNTDIICKVIRSKWSQIYVLTSSCVLLLDERYSKVPMRKWHHMMFNQPSFADISKVNNCEVLFLGNRTEMKTCAIANEWNGNSKNSESISGIPKHFDTFRDTVQFAHEQNIWFHHSVDRLGSNLTGFTSCIHPEDNNLLCLFLKNDKEDIFLQIFQGIHKEAEAKVGKGDKESSSLIGKKMLCQWEKSVIEVTMEKVVLNKGTYSMQTDYASPEKSLKSTFNDSNTNKMFWNVQQHVINRCLKRKKHKLLDTEDTISTEKKGSKSLEKYIPSNLYKGIKSALNKKCNDNLSLKVLSLWQERKREETDFYYRKAPFNIDSVGRLPKRLKVASENRLDNTLDFNSDTEMSETSYFESCNESLMSQSLLMNPDGNFSDASFLTPKSVTKQKGKKCRRTMDGF